MKPFTAGYSKTPLYKKLGCKPGRAHVLVTPPDGFAAYLEAEGFDTLSVRGVETVPEKAEHVHWFTDTAAHLEAGLPILEERIARAGQIWVSWPKKASKVPTDVTGSVVRSLALRGDLVDVKVCAVDETWSGLKLVIRKERR